MTNKYHYVYRITNIQEKKHYYGVRSSKIEPKLDLGIKYFSSSKDKEFIKDQKENKSIFKYKIIKQFDSGEEAVNLEIKLHSKFNVGVNESFYNKSKQTSLGWDRTGIKQPKNLPNGCKIMNNGINYKLVKPDEFIYYINNNYVFGGKPLCDRRKTILRNRIISDNTKQKMKDNHADVKGALNPNSKIINIYNSNNKLVATANGNFGELAISMNLPAYALTNSYKNNGTPIGLTNYSLGNLKKKGHEIYAGWYAKCVS